MIVQFTDVLPSSPIAKFKKRLLLSEIDAEEKKFIEYVFYQLRSYYANQQREHIAIPAQINIGDDQEHNFARVLDKDKRLSVLSATFIDWNPDRMNNGIQGRVPFHLKKESNPQWIDYRYRKTVPT